MTITLLTFIGNMKNSHRMKTLKKILIFGATSQIGFFLIPRLLAAGYKVHAVSRKPFSEQLKNKYPELITHYYDVRQPTINEDFTSFTDLIYAAPLEKLADLLQTFSFTGIKRLIAFSSTSRFTKTSSSSPQERVIAQQLIDAEQAIKSICQTQKIHYTIFRPTLIYGCNQDKNISFIQAWIKKYRFFPLIGKGQGLRQPVHADDLALACLQVLPNPSTFNKAYNLSGGETLSYQTMVKKIFQYLGLKPRFIYCPIWLLQILLRLASLIPRYQHLTPAMLQRMEINLVFDHEPALHDFNYQPRAFEL